MVQEYGMKKAEEIIKYSYENSTDPTRHVIPPQYHNQQHHNSNIQPSQQHQPIFIPPNINKFSPAYARIIGAKPKATPSANIKLGGVY